MNFFQHQAKAEQKTGKLVVLFLLAIVAIIVALYFVGVLALSIAGKWVAAGAEGPQPGLWQPELLVTVSVAAIAVIGLGSLFKIAALKAGGTTVASRLGGKRIVHETSDPLERQLINVVEEMAIASGLPCPAIYVMEREAAINAFAAGYTPNDAAVAVTRGCLEQLDRDELQGVIAHEFSHILNGDMRLNIRLIGILNGILVIGLLGYAALRISAHSSGSRSRQGGGVIMAIMAAGAGAMVIGYVGVVFGRLIKAAVSRQREYLADASAVAMTRHPKGLAGALSTISRFSMHGRLKARHAEEASHMFFANGLAPMTFLANSMATHPPLEERIKRIDKSFDPKDHVPKEQRPKRQRDPQPKGKRKQPEAPTPEKILGMIGVLTADHIDRGAQMHDDMPEAIRLAAHDPLGAVTLSYALLLDEDADARKKQLAALGNPAIAEETERMRKHVDALDPELLMPTLDLALPALRGLGAERAEHFLADIKRLIERTIGSPCLSSRCRRCCSIACSRRGGSCTRHWRRWTATSVRSFPCSRALATTIRPPPSARTGPAPRPGSGVARSRRAAARGPRTCRTRWTGSPLHPRRSRPGPSRPARRASSRTKKSPTTSRSCCALCAPRSTVRSRR